MEQQQNNTPQQTPLATLALDFFFKILFILFVVILFKYSWDTVSVWFHRDRISFGAAGSLLALVYLVGRVFSLAFFAEFMTKFYPPPATTTTTDNTHE